MAGVQRQVQPISTKSGAKKLIRHLEAALLCLQEEVRYKSPDLLADSYVAGHFIQQPTTLQVRSTCRPCCAGMVSACTSKHMWSIWQTMSGWLP